jgi:hypothetical protein
MAWREVTVGETRWSVSPIAERTAKLKTWRLVLSFRAASSFQTPIRALYPLESSSRSALFAQADQIPVDRITALLAGQIQ